MKVLRQRLGSRHPLGAQPQRLILTFSTLGLTTAVGVAALVGCGGGSGSSSAGLPAGKASQAQVSRGRQLVTTLGCTDCHNRNVDDPASSQWLAGYIAVPGVPVGAAPGSFQIGPFATYCPNLTPDAATGLGGNSDRQIYNALKFGLDPGDTPDVVISSTTPGQGNFPTEPHYLAPPMPWPSFRHLPDSDLWAIVAYLKHGIKPVTNAVPDSQGPPDHWASSYTPDKIGPETLPAYPAAGEQFAP